MTGQKTAAELLRHHLADVRPGMPVHIAVGAHIVCSMTAAELRAAVTDQPGIRLPPYFLLYAFRYALGRRTHAVIDAADALIAHRDQLSSGWPEQIVRDIDEAIAKNRAGAREHVTHWLRVKEALQP